MDSVSDQQALELVDRLCAATNAHDLEGIVECFTADYRNETPVHPARGFVGREQVRRNWQHIFAFVPDVAAKRRRQHGGRKHDLDGVGAHRYPSRRIRTRDARCHHLRSSRRAAERARFYLEPADVNPADADEAVRQLVAPTVNS